MWQICHTCRCCLDFDLDGFCVQSYLRLLVSMSWCRTWYAELGPTLYTNLDAQYRRSIEILRRVLVKTKGWSSCLGFRILEDL